MTFEPAGDHSNASMANLHLLHGTLPREVVCTENLTPFLKLLPCKGKVGIASLLDGHKLFDAAWQTMAIDFRPVCPADGSACYVEMEQTVDVVLDMERSKRPRGKLQADSFSRLSGVIRSNRQSYSTSSATGRTSLRQVQAICRHGRLLSARFIFWAALELERSLWPYHQRLMPCNGPSWPRHRVSVPQCASRT